MHACSLPQKRLKASNRVTRMKTSTEDKLKAL